MARMDEAGKTDAMEVRNSSEASKFLQATSKVAKDISDKFRKRSFDVLKLEEYGPRKCEHLETVIKSFSKQLLSHIEAECKIVVDEFGLEQKLQDLAKLKEEQAKYKGTPAWRPSGRPDDDIEDHLRQPYQELIQRLTAELNECEEKSRQLEAQVVEGKRALEVAEGEVEAKVAEIRKQYHAMLKAEAAEQVPANYFPS